VTDEAPKLLLCNRVGEPTHRPLPGTEIRECTACGHPIHVSPSSAKAVETYPAMKVLCVECGLEHIPAAGMEVALAPGQLEELEAVGLNVSFAEGTLFRRPS
jgi:methylmalonyl-CoA mutase cobalamin-binding subunit